MVEYFIFGWGFYLGLCLNNLESFDKATTIDWIRGFIVGFLLWPIGIAIIIYLQCMEKSK